MKKLSEILDGFPHLEPQRKAVAKLEEELSLWEAYMDNQHGLIDQALAKSKIYGGVSLALKDTEVRINEKINKVSEVAATALSNILAKVRWGLDIIDMHWPSRPWADGMQEFEVETIIHTLKVQLNEYRRVLSTAM